MLDFILSVVCTVLLLVILKLFNNFKVEKFTAIVINYWVALVVGMLATNFIPEFGSIHQKEWFPHAVALGFLFITGFYVIGLSLQHIGVAISTVVQKMSLVISVPFAILYFQEDANLLKVSAITLALLAVVCINIPAKKAIDEPKSTENSVLDDKKSARPAWIWFLPIYLLLSSGAIECLLQSAQNDIIKNDSLESANFTMISFALAATMGSIFLVYSLITKRLVFDLRSVIGGIILGIPNYFSIFFLIRSFSWLDKSVVLPLNNISIVVLTALIGLIFFKESLTKINLAGLLLAVGAIILLSI